MSERSPVRGIVFAHGDVGFAFVDAVQRITGCPKDALEWLSNREGSPDVLREQLEALLQDGPAIVFADVEASSCATLARLCCRTRASTDRAVIVGVNLPMLLDFVFHRELPVSELVPRLLERGRKGIGALPF